MVNRDMEEGSCDDDMEAMDPLEHEMSDCIEVVI